jgi:2-amino-4-hydroxy-6-hydroxymethyldihydropteridine diphosphokinase
VNEAFISIGSNIEPAKNYMEALGRLARLGTVKHASAVYQTPPVGGQGSNYMNGAVLLGTSLGAVELKQMLKRIEAEMGRVRTADRNAPRTIDLDLVLYNQDRIDEPGLRVPDPLILTRFFLAQTLSEVSADYVHPTTGEPLREIAARLRASDPTLRPDAEMTARVRHWTEHIGDVAHA